MRFWVIWVMRQEEVRVTALKRLKLFFVSTKPESIRKLWSLFFVFDCHSSLSKGRVKLPFTATVSVGKVHVLQVAEIAEIAETWDIVRLCLFIKRRWISVDHIDSTVRRGSNLLDFNLVGSASGTTCLAPRWNPPTELLHRERIRHLPCHGLSSNCCKVFDNCQHIATYFNMCVLSSGLIYDPHTWLRTSSNSQTVFSCCVLFQCPKSDGFCSNFKLQSSWNQVYYCELFESLRTSNNTSILNRRKIKPTHFIRLIYLMYSNVPNLVDKL